MEAELVHLATIAEQASEGIATADMEGVIQYVNQAWSDMHGYDNREELVGENRSIFHTDEQIKNDVAYSDNPVNLVGISAGVSYGALGSTHHSLHDLAVKNLLSCFITQLLKKLQR